MIKEIAAAVRSIRYRHAGINQFAFDLVLTDNCCERCVYTIAIAINISLIWEQISVFVNVIFKVYMPIIKLIIIKLSDIINNFYAINGIFNACTFVLLGTFSILDFCSDIYRDKLIVTCKLGSFVKESCNLLVTLFLGVLNIPYISVSHSSTVIPSMIFISSSAESPYVT